MADPENRVVTAARAVLTEADSPRLPEDPIVVSRKLLDDLREAFRLFDEETEIEGANI